MNKRIPLLLVFFVVLVVLSAGTASAADPYASYDSDGWGGKPYIIFQDGAIENGTYLSNNIKWSANLTTWNDQTIVSEYDDGWLFAGVYRYKFNTGYYDFSNQNIYFEGDGVNPDIEFDGNTAGYYIFNNSTITGIDGLEFLSAIRVGEDIKDSTFDNVDIFNVYDLPLHRGIPFNVTDVTFKNGNDQLKIEYRASIDGGTFRDIHYQDVTGLFLEVQNATNSQFYNISADGAPADDSGTGIFFAGAGSNSNYATATGGHDNKAWNITLNGTGRSGFDLSQFEYNFTGNDIEVNYSGHNGIDLHGQWNVTLRDVTVRYSDLENFMITSPNAASADDNIHDKSGYVDVRTTDTASHDIWIYNLYTEDATGSDLSLNRFINVYFENVTSVSSPKFGNINTAEDLTLVNVTATGMTSDVAITLGTGGTYGYINNTTLVDCNFTSALYNPVISLYDSRNTTLINTVADGGIALDGAGTNDVTVYWNPNIKVVNFEGQPVANAIITSNTTTRNGYGSVQTTFYTGNDGYIDYSNRSNKMAIPDYYRDNSGTTQIYSTLTATKNGETDSVSDINPDSSWYDVNGELITLTLDVEGTGLIITDYFPTDTTPSLTLGDSLNFTVSTSKTADIQWFSNGDLKVTTNDKNFSYYDKTPSSTGEYNVTVIADDGVDTVSQTWTLTVTEATGGSDETTSNQNADIWIKNISILSIVTLIMIIAIPLTAMMAIRRDGELPEGSMNKITVAMIMLMILAVIITLGTAVMEHMSGAFT